jgi:predicted nucleotidyltransferase
MKRPSIPQSHLRFPLTHLLGNESHVRVLRSLIAFGGPLSVAQLARESGLSKRGTRQILDSLVNQQMVKVFGQARSQVFAVDFQHPLSQGLKDLFSCEQSRWGNLLQTLRDILQPMEYVAAAWYYGSVARGEDAPRSDLDIAIVAHKGDVDSAVEAVRQALLKVEDDYYVSCSVLALSPADVKRLSKGDEWWNTMANVAKTLKGLTPVQYAKTLLRHSKK